MSYTNDFDLFVGGICGVFKGVKLGKSAFIAKNIQKLQSISKDHEITSMSWGDDEEKEILIGCGSKQHRSIKIYDTDCAAFTNSFVCNTGAGKINGISRYENNLLTSVVSGHVTLWKSKEENEILIEAGSNIERMRHSIDNKNLIATGGKENTLKIYNLENKKIVFEEKNVKNDWLEMRVPQWTSDIGFFPQTSMLATCSRYGYIRLYDPSAQRRPVINLEIKDQALTTLAIAPQERQIIVGSGKGIMNLIDLRKPGKVLNTYKDFVGGITAIHCTKNEVVSVGLDRYLRIHDLVTKKLQQKTFLTSKLKCLLVRRNFNFNEIKAEEDDNDKDGNDSGDDSLDEMMDESIDDIGHDPIDDLEKVY
ncbi:WD repeat-containing protein 74 [Aphidius gifuensis]|uniref:WD repeat-containing protein 74 n=1 Tax=Aphidius gifuensis TaxID=684658 RepID=UPI001CDC92A0|nr:WD repeat-containing protein 74 [Aphidius gifuensis]